jgi:hypothetical protein
MRPTVAAQSLTVEGGAARVEIGPGGTLAVGQTGATSFRLTGAEPGLWRLVFEDKSVLDASSFPGPGRTVRVEPGASSRAAELVFEAPEAIVRVVVAGHEAGVDLTGTVTPRGGKAVVEFVVPGRLRFDPKQIRRVVAPMHPHYGIGGAFRPSFYQPQPVETATEWMSVPTGPAAYNRLVGSAVGMLDMKAPPVKPRVTEAGLKWFGPDLSARLESLAVDACRPSPRAMSGPILLETAGGPLFAAQRLGGTGTTGGALWRWGGFIRSNDDRTAVVEATTAVVRRLASLPSSTDRQIGWIDLAGGPDASPYRSKLESIAHDAKRTAVAIRSTTQLLEALRGKTFCVIVNPGGESLPVADGAESIAAMVDAIGTFVKSGGHWFETGGYPFYAALVPQPYLAYDNPYPPAFADWLHVESADSRSSLAVYRIQPRTWTAWQGLTNPSAIFVPGRIAHGGDAQGGYLERAYGTWVKSGATWTAPAVRLAAGRNPLDSLADYATANGLTRRLAAKMSPALLAKLKQSVLVKVNANAAATTAALGRLPVPTLIHQANYLRGGFDKEYPDHLPPNPKYGTADQMAMLHTQAHQAGHLVMPYTNPTWWCDHPRGPTFAKVGESPLLRDLRNQPFHEQYATNDGWTTTMWHPAVRAVNTEIRRQFVEDFPVDILFQDQCGARTWKYDINPASPTPIAYVEGILSLIDEDSAVVPLGTEDGYDRVMNAESLLCGFTAALLPGRAHGWQKPLNAVYPPATWDLFPVAQALAHDKSAMLHHDLGVFVTDRPTMAWTLALGFNMSGVISDRGLSERQSLEWLGWLDRVQKSVCARWTGEPLRAFDQTRGPTQSQADGFVKATYGDVTITANLTPEPMDDSGGATLPGWSWRASAPGLSAGDDGLDSDFVVETRADATRADAWWFAREGQNVSAQLPTSIASARAVRLTFDATSTPVTAPVTGGRITVTLPSRPPTRPAGTPDAGKDVPIVWHATLQPVTAP